MQRNRTQASDAPPARYHGAAGFLGRISVEVVAAVVEMVRVAVAALAPVMLAGLVEPKLKQSQQQRLKQFLEQRPRSRHMLQLRYSGRS
jgi:hypothetical protein